MNRLVMVIFAFILLASMETGCLNNSSSTTNFQSINKFIVDIGYTESTLGWNSTRFNSIQTAIDAAPENSTIFVHPGIYHENIIIDKNITLIGEDANTTIISGNGIKKDVIQILPKGRATIKGFTIKNSGRGKYYHIEAGINIRSNNNTICNNFFVNNYCGIYVIYSDYNIVTGNMFYNNSEYGAYFRVSSDYNIIKNNVFYNNKYGLRIKGSTGNNVSFNIFLDNKYGLYMCCGSNYNTIFCNIFKDNQEWNVSDAYTNSYDNGSVGNYWASFHTPSQGAYDNDSDGIVDRSYRVYGGRNHDNYPLINPPAIDNIFLSMVSRKIT